MIEKLKKKQTKFGYVSEESPLDMLDKINELVDAVNELQKKIDPYTEQRKWIGKKCKFWDNDHEKPSFDILAAIYDNHECPFITKHGYIYHYCEPVKPDDDIIYKGE